MQTLKTLLFFAIILLLHISTSLDSLAQDIEGKSTIKIMTNKNGKVHIIEEEFDIKNRKSTRKLVRSLKKEYNIDMRFLLNKRNNYVPNMIQANKRNTFVKQNYRNVYGKSTKQQSFSKNETRFKSHTTPTILDL